MKIKFNLFATLLLCVVFSACPPTCEFPYEVTKYECKRYVFGHGSDEHEMIFCKGSGHYQEIETECPNPDCTPNPIGGCQYDDNGIHDFLLLGHEERCDPR